MSRWGTGICPKEAPGTEKDGRRTESKPGNRNKRKSAKARREV